MTNATLSQYDQEFADAMALKLRLNRKRQLIKKYGEFRVGIAEQTCKQHPNADLEEVLIGIEEAGF
jgi:hypothetical protein